LEERLYFDLLAQVRAFTISLRELHKILAQLDVLNSLAILASEETFVRPSLDRSRSLVIDSGKHPVMIQLLPGKFIANSIEFTEQKFCAILTGANMGGKSTYLRQTALLVIMAQIGSFVPAKRMQLGIVDRIFARLGASDDLLEGESTFMVEMREAAHIVSAASENSLLLIDEIGRGTATTDGLALAQAILEWICKRIKSRCMFATHFHEITKLSELYSCIFNLSVASIETEGRVVFTHEIKNGPANRSYGIEVAKLAGLPNALLERAYKLLEQIVELKESKELNTKQLSIFEDLSQTQVSKVSDDIKEDLSRYNQLIDGLSSIDINNITPIEAMNLLVQLKKNHVH
jgi:DNA mismatch repair protein MutS